MADREIKVKIAIDTAGANSSVKDIKFESVEIGYGRMITVTNIFIFQQNLKKCGGTQTFFRQNNFAL